MQKSAAWQKKVMESVHCWINFPKKKILKTKDAPETLSFPLAWNHYMSYGKERK